MKLKEDNYQPDSQLRWTWDDMMLAHAEGWGMESQDDGKGLQFFTLSDRHRVFKGSVRDRHFQEIQERAVQGDKLCIKAVAIQFRSAL